jgi:hypothetical protein
MFPASSVAPHPPPRRLLSLRQCNLRCRDSVGAVPSPPAQPLTSQPRHRSWQQAQQEPFPAAAAWGAIPRRPARARLPPAAAARDAAAAAEDAATATGDVVRYDGCRHSCRCFCQSRSRTVCCPHHSLLCCSACCAFPAPQRPSSLPPCRHAARGGQHPPRQGRLCAPLWRLCRPARLPQAGHGAPLAGALMCPSCMPPRCHQLRPCVLNRPSACRPCACLAGCTAALLAMASWSAGRRAHWLI